MGKMIFEGIKVLDFSSNMSGPYATQLLSDFGAEVIKVERPVFGDDTRNFWPQINGQGVSSTVYNKGKRSVEIDLTDPEGIEIIKKMIPDMDIFIETNKPGVMKKFGLDYESVCKIKPDIIYCSISAFGQKGLYSDKPGYDLIAQAMSGLMSITGEKNGPPMKSGTVIADYVCALNTYGAMVAALFHKFRTGEGQYIDIALLECLLPSHSTMEISQALGKNIERAGNHQSSALIPYGLFNGKNNQSIIVCAPNNKLWAEICKVIGKPEYGTDPEFATSAGRFKNFDTVISLIENWLKTFDDINDAVKLLEQASIPCCKVMYPLDLVEDENLKSRNMLVDLVIQPKEPGQTTRVLKTKGVWHRFSKTPGRVSQPEILGQSNFEILQRYGLSKEKVQELETKWSDKVKNKK